MIKIEASVGQIAINRKQRLSDIRRDQAFRRLFRRGWIGRVSGMHRMLALAVRLLAIQRQLQRDKTYTTRATSHIVLCLP